MSLLKPRHCTNGLYAHSQLITAASMHSTTLREVTLPVQGSEGLCGQPVRPELYPVPVSKVLPDAVLWERHQGIWQC